MQAIPVIDLIGGLVVRAKAGDRDAYRPIETPLSPTADPVDVVGGFLRVYPFPTLYVADLDAIRGRGNNSAALARLRSAFPGLSLWIDSGAADAAAVEAIRRFGAPVLGSESQRDLRLVEDTPHALLSLDFGADSFLGPRELLAHPEVWPERIVVMTLARVGGDDGPDLQRLAAIRAVAGPRRVFFAGGVRTAADLATLEAAGAAGALISSALHNGRIGAANLS